MDGYTRRGGIGALVSLIIGSLLIIVNFKVAIKCLRDQRVSEKKAQRVSISAIFITCSRYIEAQKRGWDMVVP